MRNILSIISDIVYFAVLNLKIFTVKYMTPDGQVQMRVSPAERLGVPGLYVLHLICSVLSIVASILSMTRAAPGKIRAVQIAALIASTVTFIVVLAVSAGTNLKY